MPVFSTPYDPPIPATDIHDGSVSNAEFGCLNGVTSAIQTQIDGKASSLHSHAISDVTGLQTALDGKLAVNGSGALLTDIYHINDVDDIAAALEQNLASHSGQTSGVHGITAFTATILDDADAATVRGTIGLGSIATQSAASVAITGGTVTGITDLAVADGGTGASSPSAARSNLGCGTAATKDAPASGNAASGEVVLGSDTRLTDSRAPTSHNHAASEITSGTIATARLGSGTASSSTYLRGDQTWATISGGGASAIDDLSDVTITAAASGDFLRHNGTAWVDATISASDIPSGIDATKIGSGAVSNTEFGYLDGVTSAIQTQIDALSAPVTGKISTNADYTGTSDAFTVEPASLTITLPSTGCWLIDVHLNFYLTTTGVTTQYRMAMGTATINGSTSYPTGFAYAQGASGTSNSKITTGSPTLVGGTSKSSGENALVLIGRHAIDVSGAGTIKVQIAIGGTISNVAKLLASSHIRASKLV